MIKEKTAEELAEIITEKKLKQDRTSYESFRHKCAGAINNMVSNLESETVVEMDEDDIEALSRVTEELRSLGYKFAYIEVENTSGEIIKRKLRISLRHLI